MKRLAAVTVGALFLARMHPPAPEPGHVVLISIDGLAAYHLENEELELPNLRALIQEGAWARSSQTVFPSVTHPSHTTMITGLPPRQHGVLSNRMTNRLTGESFHVTNKIRGDSIRVKTLFDAAREKGLRTASFFWPETYQDPSIDYNIPEVFDDEGMARPVCFPEGLFQELNRAGIPIELYYRWYADPHRKGAGDLILAESAAYVLARYRPHLLAIHFLVTDRTQHDYGPDHYLARAALTTADQAVGILRQAVQEGGLAGRTTLLVVADHGFHTVRHELNLYPLLREHGLEDEVRLHGQGWTVFLEIPEGRRQELEGKVERFTRQASTLEGVERVVFSDQFPSLGLPSYAEDPHVLGQVMLIGDVDTHLVFRREPGPARRTLKAKPYHGHGYLPEHPRMRPALILSGAGVRSGKRLGHVSNYDIAPTVAHLLGLDLGSLPGRVLQEALSENP